MKKIISLTLCILLVAALFGFAACGKDEIPELSDEQVSELNVKVDFGGLTNFNTAVANLPAKTAINNYSSAAGYIDGLLQKAQAMKQTIEKENVKDVNGLEEFEASYEQLVSLKETAEKAAGKYVKGFYKVMGKKDVTAVYCYMNVNYKSDNGNTYIFALTYTENDTPVTIYMDSVTTSDIVEISVYEDRADAFYSTECAMDMMNTVRYNNITLDLDAVLSAAK